MEATGPAPIYFRPYRFDEFAEAKGAKTIAEKAALVGLPLTTMWRLYYAEHPPNSALIAGVMRAFPGSSYDDFFASTPQPTPQPRRRKAAA